MGLFNRKIENREGLSLVKEIYPIIQDIVKDYFFIETGTFGGFTSVWASTVFKKVFTNLPKAVVYTAGSVKIERRHGGRKTPICILLCRAQTKLADAIVMEASARSCSRLCGRPRERNHPPLRNKRLYILFAGLYNIILCESRNL